MSEVSEDVSKLQRRIMRMFERYIPAKMYKVPAALQTYAGQERQFLEALVLKFGPEPPSRSKYRPVRRASPVPTPAESGEIEMETVQHRPKQSAEFCAILNSQRVAILFEKEYSTRCKIVDSERRYRVLIEIAFRDERWEVLRIEAARQVNASLVDERQHVNEEFAATQERRHEEAIRKAFVESVNSLVAAEMTRRVSIVKGEKTERRLFLLHKSHEVARVHKQVTKRHRMEDKARLLSQPSFFGLFKAPPSEPLLPPIVARDKQRKSPAPILHKRTNSIYMNAVPRRKPQPKSRLGAATPPPPQSHNDDEKAVNDPSHAKEEPPAETLVEPPPTESTAAVPQPVEKSAPKAEENEVAPKPEEKPEEAAAPKPEENAMEDATTVAAAPEATTTNAEELPNEQ